MFRVPKGKVLLWQAKLSHKPGLTEHSRLCHHHFAEEDIIKGYDILGEFHPLKQWHLKKDVVPTLHLGLTYNFLLTWHCLITFLLFLPGIGDRNSLQPPFGNACTNSVAKKKCILLLN